jgi:hypothetical protein
VPHSFEGSVHDLLALLLWACGEAAHHGGNTVDQNLREAKEKGRGKGWVPLSPSKALPSDLKISHPVPPLKVSTTSQ